MDKLKPRWQSNTHKCIVHDFRMSDMEDIDLWVAASLYEFQKSERGKWVDQHTVSTPVWHKAMDTDTLAWRISIRAEFDEKDYIVWKLKYD